MKTSKNDNKTMGEGSLIFKTATLHYCKCPILTKILKYMQKKNPRKDGSNTAAIRNLLNKAKMLGLSRQRL